jgi:hypothetical protein
VGRRVFISFLKNFLIITIPVLIFCFILLEIFVRTTKGSLDIMSLTGKKEVNNPMSGWAEPDAFFGFVAKEGVYSEGKTVNSHGFISTPEISLEKPQNTVRIVFLGGSSTAGTGFNLPDNETWPFKVVEKLKNRLDINIDYINAAVGGYSTFESYGRLWSRIRFYKPDIIVINHAWNDMYYFNDKFGGNPHLWRKGLDVNKKIVVQSFSPMFIDKYIRWSQFLVQLRLTIERVFGQNKTGEIVSEDNKEIELKDFYDERGLEIFKENLILFRGFGEIFNIPVFFCKQATLISEKNTDEDMKKNMYHYHGFDHNAHIDAYQKVYDVIDSVFTKDRIIDLTSLSGDSDSFYDHVHPTPEGTDKFAVIVVESLMNGFFTVKKEVD